MQGSENPFLGTFRLPVHNSATLFSLVAIVHFICLVLPWLSGLPDFLKIILSCVCIVSISVYYYQNVQYMGNGKAKMLILSSDDNWHVVLRNAAVHYAELDHRLFVHPWLTVISLNFDNRRQIFIFTPETLDADQFRRLRVRLRFKAGE